MKKIISGILIFTMLLTMCGLTAFAAPMTKADIEAVFNGQFDDTIDSAPNLGRAYRFVSEDQVDVLKSISSAAIAAPTTEAEVLSVAVAKLMAFVTAKQGTNTVSDADISNAADKFVNEKYAVGTDDLSATDVLDKMSNGKMNKNALGALLYSFRSAIRKDAKANPSTYTDLLLKINTTEFTNSTKDLVAKLLVDILTNTQSGSLKAAIAEMQAKGVLSTTIAIDDTFVKAIANAVTVVPDVSAVAIDTILSGVLETRINVYSSASSTAPIKTIEPNQAIGTITGNDSLYLEVVSSTSDLLGNGNAAQREEDLALNMTGWFDVCAKDANLTIEKDASGRIKVTGNDASSNGVLKFYRNTDANFDTNEQPTQLLFIELGISTAKKSSGGVGKSDNTGVTVKIVPEASVKSGEIKAGTKVRLTPSILTGKVYYTTDGTNPSIDENGNLEGTTKLYTGEITINEDTVIKAIAVTANGKTKSDVHTFEYTVKGIDVSISLSSGIVKAGTKVELSTKNGKDIYYTTDGTDPALDENGNPTGTTKKYTEAIEITEDTTLKAIAVDADGIKSEIAEEKYVIAPELIGDHIAYIQGDDFGNFNPELPITRAEVATIFSRITVQKMNIDTTAKATFTDVSESDWYYNAIAFMENAGVIKGYEDGSFRPNNYITRAEFAAIASRYDRLDDINENIFSDVTSLHWAFMMINSASKKGWVTGYEDGTFKPDSFIKRSEVVTVVNRMLQRNAEAEFKDKDLSGLIIFPDAKDINMHWAFYEIVEASNTHENPNK